MADAEAVVALTAVMVEITKTRAAAVKRAAAVAAAAVVELLH